VTGSLPPEIALSHAMQLPVDQRDEPVQGIPVSLPPCEQQSGDLAREAGGATARSSGLASGLG
jgi:hypothetical protein